MLHICFFLLESTAGLLILAVLLMLPAMALIWVLLALMLAAVGGWRWAVRMRKVKRRAVADKGERGLRLELASVAGFMGAEKVAHATHAIELVEKMEGLLPDLKDEAVRKRTLEEIEVLRAEVTTFTKEARRCGEEARVARLLESGAATRRGLSGAGRDY